MEDNQTNHLLARLIVVAEELSKGNYGQHNDIFELTKSGSYPPLIARSATICGPAMYASWKTRWNGQWH